LALRGESKKPRRCLKLLKVFIKKIKYESRDHFYLGEDFWDSEDKLLVDEVLDLESPFSEEEIKEAIFSCYPEGALDLMVCPSLLLEILGSNKV
jgi:hypothetical protein